MRKRNIKTVILMGMTASMLLTGCQIGKTDIIVSKSLSSKQAFQIGTMTCSMTEAKVYLVNYQNIYGSAYGINLWEGDYGANSLEEYVKDVTISELSQIICMDLLAEEQEITLTEKEKEQVAEAAEAYYETLNKAEISYMGVTENDLVTYYEHYALAQKLYNSLTEGVNDEVSDDEARVMEAMQIYVTDETKAREIAEKLTAGEDFASVANNYNEATSIEITIARDDMPEEVEEEAFRLDDNEISGMITTENGYYFIKCLNKYNEELTDANKGNIVRKREKEAFDDIYEAFVQKQNSYLNVEAWEGLEIDTEDDITTSSFFEMYETYCSES
ncbi:MAG: peptidyl-prolyl cis-trans isomerase [Roseburia sp.]